MVLSSPSGGGKSTIIQRLLASNPNYTYSVSVTTRPPRADEVNGKSYWFLDQTEFMRRRDSGELLEWEEVYGDFYGTPFQPAGEAVRAGLVVLFDLDVKGALKLKAARPETITIFLSPPSFTILEQRLRARGTETEVSLLRRISLARWECDQAANFDHVAVNGDLENTVQEVDQIIQQHLTRG